MNSFCYNFLFVLDIVVNKLLVSLTSATTEARIPNSIELKQKIVDVLKGESLSVEWTSDGELTCGTTSGVVLLSNQLQIKKKSSFTERFDDVKEQSSHNLLALKHVRHLKGFRNRGVIYNTYRVRECDFNLITVNEWPVELNSSNLSKLCYLPHKQQVIAADGSKVKVFTTSGEYLYEMDLSAIGINDVRAVCHSSDDNLIILHANSCLSQVTVVNKPELIWSYPDLKASYGFCVSENLIYVAVYQPGHVEVISLDGKNHFT